MTNISNNCIVSINRGDTFTCPLFINKGTRLAPARYKLTSSDNVYFAISEPNQPFEFAVLRQIYTKKDLNENGDIMLRLNSNDTENLLPGIYYMEAKIRLKNGNVYTILPKKKFYIYE